MFIFATAGTLSFLIFPKLGSASNVSKLDMSAKYARGNPDVFIVETINTPLLNLVPERNLLIIV